MFTWGNQCRGCVKEGQLQVEMDNDPDCWVGIGHFMMVAAWAIDFIDLDKGLMGLQMALTAKGMMFAGGDCRYALLKFRNVPESIAQSTTGLETEKTHNIDRSYHGQTRSK